MLVVLFFSSSSGKRGVYVLPAVPALVMAAAPWLPELLRARGPRRLAFALASLLTGLIAAVAITLEVDPSAAARLAEIAGAQPLWPLAVMAAAAAIALAVFRVRDGWLAYGGVLAAVLVTIGLAIYPRIDAVRSCRAFMARVEQASADIPELGLAGAKEQYLLQARRPVTTFGHARWWEKEVEAADAAAWLAAGEGRGVLIGSVGREACFSAAEAADVGRANREHWFVVDRSAGRGLRRPRRPRPRTALRPGARAGVKRSKGGLHLRHQPEHMTVPDSSCVSSRYPLRPPAAGGRGFAGGGASPREPARPLHSGQRSSMQGMPGWWRKRPPHFGQTQDPAAPMPPPPVPRRPPAPRAAASHAPAGASSAWSPAAGALGP